MSNMNIGYARTSTLEQVAGFEAQVRELQAVGCDKIFKEQVSSVAQRAQLDAVLDYVREGDTLVVTKLDRLARSSQQSRLLRHRTMPPARMLRLSQHQFRPVDD